MIKFYYLLLMVFVVNIISAQNTYSLKGSVDDANGLPIENAYVMIDNTELGTSTDAYGNFEINNIEDQIISITISNIGYKSVTEEIDLSKSQNLYFVLLSESQIIDEVVVTGSKTIRKNRAKLSANRLGVRNIDMPFTNDFIDKNLIDQQQSLTLGEAISNVSGVFQFNKGYGGTSETFGARGLSLRYLGFMFRDGARFSTNQTLATPELQNIERVEVFKGGAAINFGYVSPGATINYVTKKAGFYNGGFASLRFGSYNHIKPTLDYNTMINDNLAIRFVSTGDYSESFRDNIKSKRISNFFTTKYRLNNKATLDWNIDYMYDNRPADFGLPIFEDRIVTGKKTIIKDGEEKEVNTYLQESGRQRLYHKVVSDIKNVNIGGNYNDRNSRQLNSNLNFNTKIDNNWSLRAMAGTSISSYDYLRSGSGFYNSYKVEGDDLLISRTLEKQKWNETSIGALVNVVGDVNLGAIKDRMSISVDYDNRTQRTDAYNSIRGFDKTYLYKGQKEFKEIPTMNPASDRTNKFRDIGISFQNMLHISDEIKLLASLRMDNIYSSSATEYLQDYSGRAGTFKKGDIVESDYSATAFTPAIGVTYKVTDRNSIYLSYTNSFNPNSRGRLGENDEMLEPYYTNQFEIGTKNEFADGRIRTNITYFHINDNGYVNSPNVPQRFVIGPGTRYRGVETDFSFRPIDGLSLSANYTYLFAEYNEGGFFKQGTRPQQTPEHQIGFLALYRVQDGLFKDVSFNVSGQYTGQRLGNDYYRGGIPYLQDAYTLLNAGVGYRIGKFDINLKATNLLNEFVFFSYRYGSVNPIDPTMLTTTLRYNF